jgi:hypothetical protein
MNFSIKAALLWLSPFACHAEQAIDTKFLDRLAIIESGKRENAVGDCGHSLGMYQISYSAYRDALRYMKLGFYDKTDERNLLIIKMSSSEPINAWNTVCMNADLSRLVAKAYCELIVARLKKDDIQATAITIYMCYNMGYANAKMYGFNYKSIRLSNYRTKILEKAHRIMSL